MPIACVKACTLISHTFNIGSDCEIVTHLVSTLPCIASFFHLSHLLTPPSIFLTLCSIIAMTIFEFNVLWFSKIVMRMSLGFLRVRFWIIDLSLLCKYQISLCGCCTLRVFSSLCRYRFIVCFLFIVWS